MGENQEDRVSTAQSTLMSLEAMWRLTRRRMKKPFFVRMPQETREAYRRNRARMFRQRIGVGINVIVAVVAVYVLLSLRFPRYIVAIPRESLYPALVSELVIFLIARRTLHLRALQLLSVLTVFVPLLLLTRFAVPQSSYFLILALAMGFLFPWNAIESASVTLLPIASYAISQGGPVGYEPTTEEFVAFSLSFAIIVAFQLERERERRVTYMIEEDADCTRLELEESLRLAARLHADLISDNLDTDKLSVRIHYAPMQQLGGDYVKIAPLADGRVLMLLADVTGHGAPAALMINRINGIVERLMAEGRDAAFASAELNGLVHRIFSGSNLLMSALWAEFDARAMTVSWMNYGHPSAFYLRVADGAIERMKSQAPLMGVADVGENELAVGKISVASGDLFLFYTDGLIDLETGDGRFDMDRLEGLLRPIVRPKSSGENSSIGASELLDHIQHSIACWNREERRDDLLMVVWKIR